MSDLPSKSYVREDTHGAWRVGTSKISLDSVVYAFLEGHSAEAIAQQYPALTLEDVYGAIAFYLANREAVREHLARQDKLWDEFRRKMEQRPDPLIERLRAARDKARQEV